MTSSRSIQIAVKTEAIVVGRESKAKALISLLSQRFGQVRLIESEHELGSSSAAVPPCLAVVTDSFPGGVDITLLKRVKRALNPGAIICLSDRIRAKTEIELRSVGLVFLGPYKGFLKLADAIISCAFERHVDSMKSKGFNGGMRRIS